MLRRERIADEEIRDLVILLPVHENPESLIHRAPGPPDLLIIVNHRSRALKMDNELEVRLIEPHTQRDRRNQHLELILEQFLLQLLATRRAFFLAVNIRVIGFGSDVVDPQPFCHPFGIPLRQRVNDSAAVKIRNRLRQPSHPRSGARHLDVLQLETLPHERSTHNLNACPELRGHVINHTVIGRRCCRENRNVARQRLQDIDNSPVVGAELVPPIRYAVSLIDDEQPHAGGDMRQDVLPERVVGKSLR